MRTACWLMSQFEVPEPLIGDLVEGLQRRSLSWFWRQALVAIVSTTARHLRAHKALAVRALATGWTLRWAVSAYLRRPVMLVMAESSAPADRWLIEHARIRIPISFLVVEILAALAIGWSIARFHRPYGPAMVIAFLASLLVFDAGGTVNSWQRSLDTMGPFGLAINSLFPFMIVPLVCLLGAFSTHARGVR
jgi:hypothetical protein